MSGEGGSGKRNGEGPGVLRSVLSTPTADQSFGGTTVLKRADAEDRRVSVSRMVLNTWKGARNQFIKWIRKIKQAEVRKKAPPLPRFPKSLLIMQGLEAIHTGHIIYHWSMNILTTSKGFLWAP